MPTSSFRYQPSPEFQSSVIREDTIEDGFIGKLQGLKYAYRPDITDRASLERIVSAKNDPGNGYTGTPNDGLGVPSLVILNLSFGIAARPYQVYAVKQMVKCIEDDAGNGFVWHTTDSGKTLTSFKASTLLKLNDHIHKCVFVVDRKDLDRQTREEFNKFQEGCVEENTNTAALVRRLLSEDYADKMIVTTIQNLGLAINELTE